MPLSHAAELIGLWDSEKAIRWLIIRMVLCCDPWRLRRQPRLRHGDQSPSQTMLVRRTFDTCRADAIERHSG
jgi:hypothetical protein